MFQRRSHIVMHENAQPSSVDALIDDADIHAALAAIPNHTLSLDASKHFIATLRNALSERFSRDENIAGLVQGHAIWTDRLLQRLWRAAKLADTQAALIAVGGYGRGERFPGSDVDLLILRPDDPPSTHDPLDERLGSFLMLLWDVGLEVGHSVRTISECLQGASNDVSIATNLLEARLITGPDALFQNFVQARDADPCWEPRQFFDAKLAEQKKRQDRFGETAYQLEPNVKEGPGGLRDLHMIGWIAQRKIGTGTLAAMVEAGFLRETERDELIEAQYFLWRVRFCLHELTGRREDRLLFDLQRAAASRFGFVDQNHNLAVEQFMQRYFRVIGAVQTLNDILLQHFRETFLEEDQRPERIHPRFQKRGLALEVVNDQVFMIYPVALLEVFYILQRHPELKGVRASTIRLIRAHRHLVDHQLRANPTARQLMMAMLEAPDGVWRTLRRMHRFGILANYLPAFGRITGRMQYDLFHAYTVDEHTLNVLRYARRLGQPQYAAEVPLAHERYLALERPILLVLACVFHDIAKGRGGDHSQLGALDARHFCVTHGLSDEDAELVAWLVQHHLVMSMTAQRKDISDPEVVLGFAQTIGDAQRLDLLYLLTVADIRGTNPSLWNSWKATLLETLYHSTSSILARGLPLPPNTEDQIGHTRREAARMIAAQGHRETAIRDLWDRFPKAYFVRHSTDEIVWHAIALLGSSTAQQPTQPTGDSDTAETSDSNHPALQPTVLLRPQSNRGGSEIFLHVPDRPKLFAEVTGLLAQLALNVVDARILTTTDGYTLDSFLVLDHDGHHIEPGFRSDEIIAALTHLVSHPRPSDTASFPERPLPRRLKHFSIDSRVDFEPAADGYSTRLRYNGLDRPGLLSRIGALLAENGVRVRSARIATAGERVEDVFVVSTRDDQPLTVELETRLRASLEAL